MPERLIDVCGQAHKIQVYYLAKRFWVAVGSISANSSEHEVALQEKLLWLGAEQQRATTPHWTGKKRTSYIVA
jgi:hypothetical protein